MEPMKEARANFMLTVIDNKVYVYGGISGRGTEDEKRHVPIMAESVCEVYDPVANTWTSLEMEGAFPIADFGATQLKEPTQFLIFGGTDGCMLTSNTYIVDFAAKKVTF